VYLHNNNNNIVIIFTFDLIKYYYRAKSLHVSPMNGLENITEAGEQHIIIKMITQWWLCDGDVDDNIIVFAKKKIGNTGTLFLRPS